MCTAKRCSRSLVLLAVLALGAGLLARAAHSAPGLTVVSEGQPRATIVIAAEPSENARAAADELQHYVEKMSGAKLEIITDADAQTLNREAGWSLVLVGRSALTDAIEGLEIPSGLTKNLREEGFVIRCRADRLVLAGNDEGPYKGTRYAVCALLHRLGVRWFLPGEFGEVVPRQATIEVPEMQVREAPDFPVRDFWEHARGTMGEELREWKIHNMMNPDSAAWAGVPGDSSVRKYMPTDQFEAHPEWFALRRDGTRNPHMPCMTNPEMIQHFVERCKADARAGKRVSCIGADDGAPRCYCDGCMAITSGFDGMGTNYRDPQEWASISQEWFYFINTILDEVNKEFPDHMIATNGYANRDVPPEMDGFNKSGNLVIMFANIPACTIHAYDDPHCWQMQRQGQMVRRWCELCDKVWLYNYNYTMLVGKDTLTPMVHRVRRNIPLLKQWGAWGFFDQDEADWSMCGVPVRLVRARLEWDASADVDAILDDYFQKWFGAAARPMRAYYDALEDAFAQAPQHGHEDVILPHIYTDRLMARLDRAMRQAQRRARSRAARLHVGLERLIHDHLRQYVALEKAKQECRYIEAADCAQRMLELKEQMNKVTPFMGWRPYRVYSMAWERERMRELATKTTGPKGRLLAVLPREAKFRTDPFDDGLYERWMNPGLDDSGWETLLTTAGWQDQGHRDARGHPYIGLGWYRFEVDVPRLEEGERVFLFAPAVVNEAWLWVNGHYAGHRPYSWPWSRPQAVELDVSELLRAGQRNQITLRVLCNTDCYGANGIYERMFLYGAKPAPEAEQEAAE